MNQAQLGLAIYDQKKERVESFLRDIFMWFKGLKQNRRTTRWSFKVEVTLSEQIPLRDMDVRLYPLYNCSKKIRATRRVIQVNEIVVISVTDAFAVKRIKVLFPSEMQRLFDQGYGENYKTEGLACSPASDPSIEYDANGLWDHFDSLSDLEKFCTAIMELLESQEAICELQFTNRGRCSGMEVGIAATA